MIESSEILDQLRSTPRALASLSDGLNPEILHHRTPEEPWSANDILAHLRACADVWGESILEMLEKNHPTIRYVSPRTWMKKTNYPRLEFHESLAAFTRQRLELMATLVVLEPAGWQRSGTFLTAKQGREQTVLDYAQRLVEHEASHLDQLKKLLAP
jgi:hypothetical protein